jgi:CubicO group peptidase (beta-lactamase class C family)
MSANAVSVDGRCDPAFTAVRDAFAGQLADGTDLGAAVSVSVDGRTVVDLWGGYRDRRRTQPWERDTLVTVWSTIKGAVALVAHVLADRGLLDVDAPVARYWPEFAAAGKVGVTVRDLLSHRAGLAGLREPTSLADLGDWPLVTGRLAAMEPWWEPGAHVGYHALTFGYLVGEVIGRVSGRSLRDLLAAEVARPLEADVHIGLPPQDRDRVAPAVGSAPDDAATWAAQLAGASPVARAALTNPVISVDDANTALWLTAEIPALNGYATASAVAALYQVYAGRGGPEAEHPRLLSQAQIDRAREGQGRDVDLVAGAALGGRPSELSLGYWLGGPEGDYGPNPRAFGHDGRGGSFGFADPEAGLAMGYVTNLISPHPFNDPRKRRLVAAVYASL